MRNIGLFGIVELVRNRETMEPMAPFNGTTDEMVGARQALPRGRPLHLRALEHFFTNPPLTITEEELARGSRSSIAPSR